MRHDAQGDSGRWPPARSEPLDLLLLVGLCLTALVATLTAIWVVPMVLIAALAAAADDAA